jgi:hypothetical protein
MDDDTFIFDGNRDIVLHLCTPLTYLQTGSPKARFSTTTRLTWTLRSMAMTRKKWFQKM